MSSDERYQEIFSYNFFAWVYSWVNLRNRQNGEVTSENPENFLGMKKFFEIFLGRIL